MACDLSGLYSSVPRCWSRTFHDPKKLHVSNPDLEESAFIFVAATFAPIECAHWSSRLSLAEETTSACHSCYSGRRGVFQDVPHKKLPQICSSLGTPRAGDPCPWRWFSEVLLGWSPEEQGGAQSARLSRLRVFWQATCRALAVCDVCPPRSRRHSLPPVCHRHVAKERRHKGFCKTKRHEKEMKKKQQREQRETMAWPREGSIRRLHGPSGILLDVQDRRHFALRL